MRRYEFFRFGSLCLILPLLASPAALHAEDKIASGEAKRLWLKGADQVLAGRFDAGASSFRDAMTLSPGADKLRNALSWLDEAKTVSERRADYRKQMYEFYVKKALDAAQKARDGVPLETDDGETIKVDETVKMTPVEDGETTQPPLDNEKAEDKSSDKKDDDDKSVLLHRWSGALFLAQNAMSNCEDEATFRQEPWLQEIVANVMREIKGYEADNDWRDALVLYDSLKTIFPRDERYEAGYDFCRKRAHLEFVYGPEREGWKDDLSEVSPEAVYEIIERIEQDYVDKPNWRELGNSAIEHLLILAECDTLSETFPTLAERDLVKRFTVRLNGYLRRYVEGDERFRGRDMKNVFRRIMDANRDTIDLPMSVIVDEFTAGMLDPLDEFTSVIWPAEVNEFNKQTRGQFVGVGIQITQEPGKPVRVESPLPDSPAFNAGIKPGDFITKVDGKATVDMTINDAVREITGTPGTEVILTIQDGVTMKEKDVPLKRAEIRIRTVKGHSRDDTKPTGWDFFIDQPNRIGYIRVSGFIDDTVEDLEAALNQLRQENAKGLILDLRFNPGGLLTSAVNMCEVFLGANARIVQTKGRNHHQNMQLNARGPKKNHDFPMIVLVNEYSASASEIVAGALAGLKEACIVGTRSFGKGSVQNLIPILGGRAYLKLTTAHYYVPDADMPDGDQWYLLHRKKDAEVWGVEPHIKVDTIPAEVAKVLRLRRERDVLKGKDQSEVPDAVLNRQPSSEPPDEFPEDPLPDLDPQLTTAINVMRMKLASHQPWALAPRVMRTAASLKMEEVDGGKSSKAEDMVKMR